MPVGQPGSGGPRRRSPWRVVALAAAVVSLSTCGCGTADVPAASPSAEITPTITSQPELSFVPVPPSVPPASAGAGDASPSRVPASLAPATGIRANHIRIERLGIDLKVVEGDGIDAPMGKAAHHPDTAWPGAGSNVYIYGHAQEGMFLALWDAREGDVVELGLVDGTTRAYVVAKVLPKVPWDAVKYLRPTATEQLTLQTSTSYTATAPRFIVIARPAP